MESRIKKIEKSIPVNNRPFRNLSEAQLVELSLRLRRSIYQRIKNEDEANEYRELFLDNPTIFEMLRQTEKTNDEMLGLLAKQRDWEIKHEERQDIKEKLLEEYEQMVKAYRFFKKV